ncbi:MAG: glycosyltransferase family 4 protein [Candidatus Omnitrophota bacterium]
MNICFVSGAYPPQHDGIADYTAQLAHALLKTNDSIRVSVITSIVHVSQDTQGPPRIHRIVKKWNIFGIAAIIHCVLKEHFDIVHIQFPSVEYRKTFLFCILPLLLRMSCHGIKVVLTLHEFSVSRPINKLRQFILSILSQQVIVTDPYEYAQIVKLLPAATAKVTIIPIGSNINTCMPNENVRRVLLEQFGVNLQPFIVSFFGVIHPDKGFECLLRALAQLVRDPIPVHVLAISDLDQAHNAYHAHIVRMIETLKVKAFISITGYQTPEKVSQLLFISDICVLTFVDGVSLRRGTLMAALAHYKPIIATRARSYVPDLLRDKENIILVPLNDCCQLAQAIATLYRDSALRDKLSAGAASLAKEFSWETIASSHRRVYNKIINGKTFK